MADIVKLILAYDYTQSSDIPRPNNEQSPFLPHLIGRLGDCFQSTESWERAIECYERALEVDDLAEDIYQHLMACYQKLDQYLKAIEVYRRLKAVLSSSLGTGPSPKTEAIYKALTGNIKIRDPNS